MGCLLARRARSKARVQADALRASFLKALFLGEQAAGLEKQAGGAHSNPRPSLTFSALEKLAPVTANNLHHSPRREELTEIFILYKVKWPRE